MIVRDAGTHFVLELPCRGEAHEVLISHRDLPIVQKWRVTVRQSPRKSALGGVYYYAHCRLSAKRSIPLHRAIMMPGFFLEVDHINGNGLDNRRENLRIVTKSENQQNILLHRDSIAGHKNVYWQEGQQHWLVQVCLNYKRHHGGTYKNLEDAVAAATALRIKLHTHCKENSL